MDNDIAAAVAYEHCKRTLSKGLKQPVLGEGPSTTFKTGSKNVQSEGEASTGQKSREKIAAFKSKLLLKFYHWHLALSMLEKTYVKLPICSVK